MNVLVTGVGGYVGSRLAARLLREGYNVRGFSRRDRSVRDGITMVTGDAVTGQGLDRALEGIEVAYFLIHSMERSGNGTFDARERAAAENFAAAASAAGVGRIVYLGGLVPNGGPASQHLASRLAVENILMGAVPGSV